METVENAAGAARRPGRGVRRAAASVRNALEIMRLGRLTARIGASYDVVHQGTHYRLRHYGSGPKRNPRSPLLLVPPLMLTAEIYDVAEEISAARVVTNAGIDVWVVDFGAPENIEGGMTRTLDDHVRAVAEAVGKVRDATGHDVHLAGYSQGGMFCYQAAAYRKTDGVASIITFGSPVDIHRNLPNVSTDLTARLIRVWRPLVEPPLRMIDGLPGILTSTGFKIFSIRKEISQIAEFLSLLHDRRALEKRESRRRFLAGEGFVAWPGPALLKFIDEFVVHNRMMSGGFVVNGRTVTLADITCPILFFVGSRDDIARPPSVRAVTDVTPAATHFEVSLKAGHFGLVVGSTAMAETWPTVIEWVEWRQGTGALPRLLEPPATEAPHELEDFPLEVDFELFYETAFRTIQSMWKSANERLEDAGETLDNLRFQLPRLMRLRRIEDDTELSPSRTLEKQARRIGAQSFFLYAGRAVTFEQANQRVDHVVRGLIHCGVVPGMHVGVLMGARPSSLSAVLALSRLGAVPVLISATVGLDALEKAVGKDQVQALITDPEHAEVAKRAFTGKILVLGGGPSRTVTDGVLDMEAIDPDAVELPTWYRPNPGRAEDLFCIIVTVSSGKRRAARITNRRWAFSAYGAAAACTLSGNDTVYCCLPLHHPAGLLVAAGSALAGGARLALAKQYAPDVFWEDVRRYGATVAFYAGEMCRALVDAPSRRGERAHPLRLFAGSGMRADVWQRLEERFGVGVLEFYAATEVSVVLANASGKVGALGRPLPGSREALLGAYQLDRGEFVRDREGRIVEARAGQLGILLARFEPGPRAPLDEPAALSERPGSTTLPRIVRGVHDDDDAWFVTRDLMTRDDDGDYWYVDSTANLVRTADGPMPTRPVEDALYTIDSIRLAAVYGVPDSGAETMVATVVLKDGRAVDAAALDRALGQLPDTQVLPSCITLAAELPLTDGYRVLKDQLRARGLPQSPAFVRQGDRYRDASSR